MMMRIRYVQPGDLEDIYQLAEKAGFGLTSLQPHREKLLARIQRACDTVQGLTKKADQVYLFVLEDTQINKVVGLCGIEVALGLSEPWYNFHVGTQVHTSSALGVYKALPTLFLSNDHTNCSELCTLFLDPDYRKNSNGKFLSKIRFLFIAAFQSLFEKKIVAEMRGFSDEKGESPFWDAVGHKFFNIEFNKADYLSGTGQKAFIAELMPRYPLYIDMLPEEAQAVIGKVHPNTVPASKLLYEEGLRYQGYVDIFDGGATLEADVENLRAMKQSQSVQVKIVDQVSSALSSGPMIVANDDYNDYKAILVAHCPENAVLQLTASEAAQLEVQDGGHVRLLSVNVSGEKACL
ncbi:Arginine N-succinyltransferase [Prolinoborus fasciculus]|jgi:arginine N-succinyltransferase|nr:arginine N-succinyltransferase [Prolinoborus fasciculus]SPJ21559.1 Arginine N-succinyltransferase [Prolinoborus fasciculus]